MIFKRINRKQTDNTMANKENKQTKVYKHYIENKTEQHELHRKPVWISCTLEELRDHVPHLALVVRFDATITL